MDMIKVANSSDKQEFGSFYLSRYLGFNISFEGFYVKQSSNTPMFNRKVLCMSGIIATAMDVAIGKKLWRFVQKSMLNIYLLL